FHGMLPSRQCAANPGAQAPGPRAPSDRGDADHVAVEFTLDGEIHAAVGRGKQRVVTAHTHVRARVELGATLAHDDRAGRHQFTNSPPKAFTPSILGLESRPFRVEPPPFFCAISNYSSGRDRS